MFQNYDTIRLCTDNGKELEFDPFFIITSAPPDPLRFRLNVKYRLPSDLMKEKNVLEKWMGERRYLSLRLIDSGNVFPEKEFAEGFCIERLSYDASKYKQDIIIDFVKVTVVQEPADAPAVVMQPPDVRMESLSDTWVVPYYPEPVWATDDEKAWEESSNALYLDTNFKI